MNRKIWSQYSVLELKDLIRKSNLRGFEKMKRTELLDLMDKHSHRFKDVKPKDAPRYTHVSKSVPKGAAKTTKKSGYVKTGKPRGRPRKNAATTDRPTLKTPPKKESVWEPQTPLLTHTWEPHTPGMTYGNELTYGVALSTMLRGLKPLSKY